MFSSQEKELLRKKREQIEEAERAKKSKVVMTFDLVGRKVNLSFIVALEKTIHSMLVMIHDFDTTGTVERR